MLSNQQRRLSDAESISSRTSNATSRATTLPDPWSDATLMNPSIQLNIQPPTDDRSSTVSSRTATVSTVVNTQTDKLRINNNQSNGITTNNPPQQQPWVNPYWGANSKSNVSMNSSATNQINSNANIGQSPLPKRVQQLIPGSILINDKGEIDDSSWKENGRFMSSTSDISFNPGGQYISDGNGGVGGYLAPIHIQRPTAPSSPSLAANQSNYTRSSFLSDNSVGPQSTFNQEQNFSQSTGNNIQTSASSYRSSPYQIDSQFTENSNTIQNQTSNIPKQNSSVNPYWNTNSPQKSTSSIPNQQQSTFQQNSYTNDKNILNPGINGAILNKSVSFDYKDLPIPPFYERVFPPDTLLSSNMPNINTTHQNTHPNGITRQNTNTNEDLPYTIDNQGVVHYQAATTSSSMTVANKTVNIVSSSTVSQYPVLPSHVFNTIPPSQTTNSGFHSSPNNITPGLLMNLNNLSITPSVAVLTEADLMSIQHALHLIETNSNPISIIETPTGVASSNLHPPFVAPLLAAIQEQHSRYQPSSSSSQPSYPVNIKDFLRRLLKDGSYVLI